MVISEMWTNWRPSTLEIAIEVRRRIFNNCFWVEIKFTVDVIEPIIDVIRYRHTNSPCLGEVYKTLDTICPSI